MLSLDNLQQTIARSVVGQPAFGLSALLAGGRYSPYGRLRIYENNTRLSLTSTLIAVFPVTVRLVDERFFRFAASEFVRNHPPREARLVHYGKEFPNFLRTFPGLDELPFVSETAKLEWAIAEALDAPSRQPRPLADLELQVDETEPMLTLQPSLRLVTSHWSVLSIWEAHQPSNPTQAIDASQRLGERVALWRSGDNVRFKRLTAPQFAFRFALRAGLSLEAAVGRAMAHDPMFDLLSELIALFGEGLVAHVQFNRSTAN
ncbi:MAG: putative DNA-binding domain-containing protein [Rhizobiaceae bacterium]